MKNLVFFILVFFIFLGFIILNLANKCDISFGFTVFPDVPVFLTALLSFMLGLILSVPVAFSLRSKKQKKLPSEEKPKKRGKLSQIEPSEVEELKKEESPYGID